MRNLVPLLALLIAAWAGRPGRLSADGPAKPDADRLVALLVADTVDPEIGESVAVDLRQVRWMLTEGVPAARLAISEAVGADVTPEKLLAAVKALPVTADDSLLLYYAGHGAWADTGPYLRMGGGKILPRADLLAALKARGARLTLLLTDCCSTYVGQIMLFAPGTIDPDVYRDLFFRHRGVVDVTAAERGQVAVGDMNLGGVFTRSLTEVFTQTERATLDEDKDGQVSWPEALRALKRSAKSTFGLYHPRGLTVRGQRVAGQTPHVFGDVAVPAVGPIPRPARRLGLRVQVGERGVTVAEVQAGSPAAWMGVRVGERVAELRLRSGRPDEETRPVAAPGDLQSALEAAGPFGLVVLALEDPEKKDAQGLPLRRELPLRLGP